VNNYILGPDADLDLDDIWEYIAADSIDAADRWIAKLFNAFEAISRMPGIGHKREDLTAYPVLFWTVGSYLIIYRARAEGQPVEIVAGHAGIPRHS
jgi:plasmid stabilization system protein ParE